MHKFEKIFNKVVTEIKLKSKNLKSWSNIPTFEYGMIYEDCAFHKLPRKFTDKLINEII